MPESLMTVTLDDALAQLGLSAPEYAVLWQVRDTVVAPRPVLAEWTARNLPDTVPSTIAHEDCVAAIASLLARGLLVELSDEDVARDLARWRSEAHPVCFGVDLRREPGDVDLTERGAETIRAVEALTATAPRPPLGSYIDEHDGVFRALGETAESCSRVASGLVAYPPHNVRGASIVPPLVSPAKPIGPWWYSRFERVERGYEIVIRFAC